MICHTEDIRINNSMVDSYLRMYCHVLGEDRYAGKMNIKSIITDNCSITVECLYAAGSSPDNLDPHSAKIRIPLINLISHVWNILMDN